MGLNWSEHSEEIAAPIETCFAAIVDYESFAGWQDAVDATEVLDRTAEGLGHNVRLFVDAKVRKIDYVLAYRYERPILVEWDFVEGNGMNAMDGAYSFEPLGPERTRATYNLGADPAIPVPGMILRRTHKQLVKRSVEDLKREAERRHAAGEGAGAAPEPEGAKAEDDREGEPARDQPEPEGAARPEAAGAWKPMAEREAARDGSGSAARGAGGGAGSASEAPEALLGMAAEAAEAAAKVGREVTEGALRASKEAAKTAIELGTAFAERLERRLGETDRDRDSDEL